MKKCVVLYPGTNLLDEMILSSLQKKAFCKFETSFRRDTHASFSY